MDCRPGCAACCIAPSISSPMPGLPNGKQAGVPCPHLDEALRCRLFGRPERPAVCSSLRPEPAMCGSDREHALHFLQTLETATAAGPTRGRPVSAT
ncbi:YkgJ family cysteine cluster protein [uncultured Hydrogenophaga sp.]|uniref:YkgJ family cysteine cluster protein n=1 Tax=uncultured Hydrogenophaga sp. TaxID=199683 RepID=UPI00265EE767|nr:YkgJ family cysteine cluster protein [uncultured Hydrogenophaga sp.]